MAKKQTGQSLLKSTEWNVGQPLAFPPARTGIKRVAQEAVDEAMRGPFHLSRGKRKKK
jgi:hypothetical protein